MSCLDRWSPCVSRFRAPVLLVFLLVGFSTGLAQTVPNTDSPGQIPDPGDLHWQIRLQDTTTVTMGAVHSTTNIDITARNSAVGILGAYHGVGGGSTVSSESSYGWGSAAGVQDELTIDFTVDFAPASLTPTDSDGDIAPLDLEEPDPSFEGAGSMTMARRTAVVTPDGPGNTKDLPSITFPVRLFIFDDGRVKLEVKAPQGSVFFDGMIASVE